MQPYFLMPAGTVTPIEDNLVALPNSSARRGRVVLCGGLALLLGSCSSGETPPDDTQPLTQSLEVKAEEGGSTALGDGAVLEIPKGALKEDTTVIFARAYCEGIYKSTWFASCNY